MSLRVVHCAVGAGEFRDGFEAYARGLRAHPGVRSSTIAVDIGTGRDLVLVQQWEDEPAFSAHWAEQVEAVDAPFTRAVLAGRVDSEFYQLRRFTLDGVWLTEADRDRTPRIVWPARGPVRLVITMPDGDIDGSLERMRTEMSAAAAEPGCEQYEWYRDLENPRSGIVLERWSDQRAFDAHWMLRRKTMRPRPATTPPGAGLGERQLEFYRYERFTHLYDRWFPAELEQRPETVVWPD